MVYVIPLGVWVCSACAPRIRPSSSSTSVIDAVPMSTPKRSISCCACPPASAVRSAFSAQACSARGCVLCIAIECCSRTCSFRLACTDWSASDLLACSTRLSDQGDWSTSVAGARHLRRPALLAERILRNLHCQLHMKQCYRLRPSHRGCITENSIAPAWLPPSAAAAFPGLGPPPMPLPLGGGGSLGGCGLAILIGADAAHGCDRCPRPAARLR